MKSEEKQRARELRLQGHSYNEILSQVNVSKGTLSLWLRDITLDDAQLQRLMNKQCVRDERFRQVLRNLRMERWAGYHEEARHEYEALSQDPSFMFGLALYIGEGDKSDPNRLCLSNCDPRVICRGVRFYTQVGVPLASMRCQIHLHPGLDELAAKQFWQEITDFSPHQFYAIARSVSRASGRRKGNIQQYGTCHLYALNTRIRQKIGLWMNLALQGPIVQR